MIEQLLIRGGKVFRDRRVSRADILIEGDKISAVGERLQAGPESARVVDASRLTILPGLIDVHSHLAIGGPEISDANLALAAAQHARDYLRCGITSVRDCGGSRHVDIALRDAILAGRVAGPSMQCAGMPIVMTGGHGHMLYRVADGVADVTRAVREQLEVRCDLVKVMCSGGVFEARESEAFVQFTDGELEALIREARAQGRPVAAHAHPAPAILRAVRFGANSIEHGSYVDAECAELMAERGVPLIPTFVVYKLLAKDPRHGGVNERAQSVYESKFAPFLAAIAAGMPWGVGSDYSDLYAGTDALIGEIEILTNEAGLAVSDVLWAATHSNAEIMGWQDRVGTIEPEMDADLILLQGDPLESLSALRHVEMTIKGGAIYDWTA